MKTLLTALLVVFVGCSASVGGFYATGSHPFTSFAVKGTVGPAEVLHAPTTQRGANDLYMVGLYPTIGSNVKATVGAGWAWWRDWGACDETGHACEHNWTNGLTAGLGLTYTTGHARIDTRYQIFTNSPFNGALLFTIGVTP